MATGIEPLLELYLLCSPGMSSAVGQGNRAAGRMWGLGMVERCAVKRKLGCISFSEQWGGE